jgi:hypothetical protein
MAGPKKRIKKHCNQILVNDLVNAIRRRQKLGCPRPFPAEFAQPAA